MFSFESAEFLYEPYPIGLVSSVLPDDLYAPLLDTFPPNELFHYLPQAGQKYVLSEKFNASEYRAFIDESPRWKALHDWIKSRGFVRAIDAMLREHHIEMGLAHTHMATHGAWAWRLGELAKGKWPHGDDVLQTRFEFSMLPANGGYVIPHTDTPRKIITLVVFMVKKEEWKESWGGGVEVGRAKHDRCAFNWLNEQIPFEDVEPVRTFEFKPNQCVVFVKTFNSLHSVRPMKGEEGVMRRSITINIMRPE
jgi:hypothetical protein